MELRSKKITATSVVTNIPEDFIRIGESPSFEKVWEQWRQSLLGIVPCVKYTDMDTDEFTIDAKDVEEAFKVLEKQDHSPTNSDIIILGESMEEKLAHLFIMYGYQLESDKQGGFCRIELIEDPVMFSKHMVIYELVEPLVKCGILKAFRGTMHTQFDSAHDFELIDKKFKLRGKCNGCNDSDSDSDSDESLESDNKEEPANGLWESVDVEAFNKRIKDLEDKVVGEQIDNRDINDFFDKKIELLNKKMEAWRNFFEAFNKKMIKDLEKKFEERLTLIEARLPPPVVILAPENEENN